MLHTSQRKSDCTAKSTEKDHVAERCTQLSMRHIRLLRRTINFCFQTLIQVLQIRKLVCLHVQINISFACGDQKSLSTNFARYQLQDMSVSVLVLLCNSGYTFDLFPQRALSLVEVIIVHKET